MNFRAWWGVVKVSEKVTGAIIGVVLTFAALSAFGLVAAHVNGNAVAYDNRAGDGFFGMGHGMMMHGIGIYHDHEDHTHEIGEHVEGCPMLKGFEGHEGLTIEDMDLDGDGLCDICGMDVEQCAEMYESVNVMGCHHDVE